MCTRKKSRHDRTYVDLCFRMQLLFLNQWYINRFLKMPIFMFIQPVSNEIFQVLKSESGRSRWSLNLQIEVFLYPWQCTKYTWRLRCYDCKGMFVIIIETNVKEYIWVDHIIFRIGNDKIVFFTELCIMKGQTTVQLLVLSAFVVSLKIGISEAVREYRPGDDISKAEILELKTMLSSMQGSLITSVSLIQGKIT